MGNPKYFTSCSLRAIEFQRREEGGREGVKGVLRRQRRREGGMKKGGGMDGGREGGREG